MESLFKKLLANFDNPQLMTAPKPQTKKSRKRKTNDVINEEDKKKRAAVQAIVRRGQVTQLTQHVKNVDRARELRKKADVLKQKVDDMNNKARQFEQPTDRVQQAMLALRNVAAVPWDELQSIARDLSPKRSEGILVNLKPLYNQAKADAKAKAEADSDDEQETKKAKAKAMSVDSDSDSESSDSDSESSDSDSDSEKEEEESTLCQEDREAVDAEAVDAVVEWLKSTNDETCPVTKKSLTMPMVQRIIKLVPSPKRKIPLDRVTNQVYTVYMLQNNTALNNIVAGDKDFF